LVEISLRILNSKYKFKTSIRWQGDTILGSRLIPNQKGIFVGHTNEYKINVSVNSKGWVDIEHPLVKDDNTYRILIIGDSFAENFQVPFEKTHAKLIEKWLKEKYPHKNFEIMSMGLGNSGTISSFLILENYGLAYNPDLVVHIFYTGNDVFNNSQTLQNDDKHPYITFSENNHEIIYPKIQENFIYQTKNYLKDNLLTVWLILNAKRKLVRTNLNQSYPFEYNIYNQENFTDIENAWEITEKTLSLIKQSANKNQARYILFATANNEQINIEVWDEILHKYPNLKNINMNFKKPDQKLNEICTRQKIDCEFMFDYFMSYKQKNPNTLTHYKIDGHWNEVGTQLAAEFMFKKIDEIISNSSFQ